MIKSLKSLLFILPLIVLSACGKGNDGVPYDNHGAGLTYRQWLPSDLPLTIQIPSSLQSYQTEIENAGATWNQALNRQVFIFQYGNIPDTQWSNTTDSLADSWFGLYRQTNWNFPNIGAGVLAYTTTMSQSNQIKHADIIFNFDNFIFDDYDNHPLPANDENYVDFESVLIHELGHFLGLNHVSSQADPDSVMRATIGIDESRRVLSEGDLYRIHTLYGN